MKNTIKTLALITATIGVAAVVKRVNGLQTQINEIKTMQNGLKSELNSKPGLGAIDRIYELLGNQI